MSFQQHNEEASEESRYKRRGFLDALRETGIIGVACKDTGVSRNSVFYWRESDPEFSAAYDEAIEDANDGIRKHIYDRATGYDEQLQYQGKLTGDTIRKYSEGMLTLLARSRMPKEFRSNAAVEISESSEMADIRERFLDRIAAMSERTQNDPTE